MPDARLLKLAAVAKSAALVPKQVRFVDIAGIIAGASDGAGLGNKVRACPHHSAPCTPARCGRGYGVLLCVVRVSLQFLSHIRNVEVIVHLVR